MIETDYASQRMDRFEYTRSALGARLLCARCFKRLKAIIRLVALWPCVCLVLPLPLKLQAPVPFVLRLDAG